MPNATLPIERNPESTSFLCKCCSQKTRANIFSAREMMYGTRELFNYEICADCASIQITQVPIDLKFYYKNTIYSSWKGVPDHISARPSILRKYLLSKRTDETLLGHTWIGRAMKSTFGPPEFPYDWSWFRDIGIKRHHSILDYGCGSGDLLRYLRANGFSHLVGYDPFSGAKSNDSDLKFVSALNELTLEDFDLIMLHHSLEHVTEPIRLLTELLSYAKSGAFFLIRIPVANTFVPRTYGPDWVQLDAPRHLVLPSEMGMISMAASLGLQLVDLTYDSTSFQFIGSEQYKANISMYDPQNSWLLGKNSPYSLQQYNAFTQQAIELNKKHDGDQAVFTFRLKR